MKKVDTGRFQQKKPEKISFQAASLPDKPPALKPQNKKPAKKTKKRTETRMNVQNKERSDERTNERSVYLIEIPQERRKIRSSFDIFEDQKTALSKIQLASIDAGNRKKPVLGDLIQEALDEFIKQKVGKEPNLKIIHEGSNETTNERSDVRS